MAEILIIGVGSAGVIATDKMNLPNGKKLFIDTESQILRDVNSEGDKSLLQCKDFCDYSGFCHCYNAPKFCKKLAEDFEDEIRDCIEKALE